MTPGQWSIDTIMAEEQEKASRFWPNLASRPWGVALPHVANVSKREVVVATIRTHPIIISSHSCSDSNKKEKSLDRKRKQWHH